MPTRRQITLPFAPREWQRPLIADNARRIVAVVHRRAGKSTGLMWRGFKRALTEKKPLPRIVHLLPYNVMWKRTGLWDQVARAADAIPGAEAMRSELVVKFPNGAVYQCGGADNPDAWRGGYADEVIADEFDDMPPQLVALVIEPMLADRGGTLVRSGTPKGRGILQAAYDRAKTTPGYSSYLLDHTKTHALSDEAIETLRREMTEEEFAQELQCSFEAPNSGSYYGKLMNIAETEGRIGSVPYDKRLPVWTSWDLGIDDSTAIWCLQITNTGEWRLIDYIEDSGAALDHYVHMLRERGYRYHMHILPHDAEVRDLGSGRSRRETLHGMGVMPSRVLNAASVADGINAVRMILPLCWFDAERCALGIRALRHYRREWNEAAQTWRAQPVHDHASHGADSMRYLSLGVHAGARQPDEKEPAPVDSWDRAFQRAGRSEIQNLARRMTEPLSGARFQRKVGADPTKWAAAFLTAYAQAEGVRTDADRQAFVAGWFAAAMRVVETNQLRALIGWSLKGQADDMSFAEVVEIAKRRLAEHDAVKAATCYTSQR